MVKDRTCRPIPRRWRSLDFRTQIREFEESGQGARQMEGPPALARTRVRHSHAADVFMEATKGRPDHSSSDAPRRRIKPAFLGSGRFPQVLE